MHPQPDVGVDQPGRDGHPADEAAVDGSVPVNAGATLVGEVELVAHRGGERVVPLARARRTPAAIATDAGVHPRSLGSAAAPNTAPGHGEGRRPATAPSMCSGTDDVDLGRGELGGGRRLAVEPATDPSGRRSGGAEAARSSRSPSR